MRNPLEVLGDLGRWLGRSRHRDTRADLTAATASLIKAHDTHVTQARLRDQEKESVIRPIDRHHEENQLAATITRALARGYRRPPGGEKA